MTLMEAAKKWNLSPNWVRELVKSGRVPAKLRTDVPVPYYDIPDGTAKPASMARAPYRKGAGPTIKEASLKRRASRDAERVKSGKRGRPRKANEQKPKAKPAHVDPVDVAAILKGNDK